MITLNQPRKQRKADKSYKPQPLQTEGTLKRGQEFLEKISKICLTKRAIAPSFVSQFELIDRNHERTQADGIKRWSKIWAIPLLQESGEVWQRITESTKDRRGYVYLSPSIADGGGNRAFLPTIPSDIRTAIGLRYGVNVPLDGSFWDWLIEHKEIPVILTEGGGKALSALSQGYVAIAVLGCTCLGSLDLLPFLDTEKSKNSRSIMIGMDADTKPSAVKAVRKSLSKWLPIFAKTNPIRVLVWDSVNKGLDDLLANLGVAALDAAIDANLDLNDFLFEIEVAQANERLQETKIRADIELNALPSADDLQALLDKHRDVFVVGAKGLGKSELSGEIVRRADVALIPTPLESLARNNAERFSERFSVGDRIVDYRTDCDRANGRLVGSGGYVDRLSFCVEAIQSLKKHIGDCLDSGGALLFNDELDLQLNSIATSSTHAQKGQRKINENLFWEMQIRSKQSLSVSADLTQYEAELFERKTGRKPYVIRVNTPKKEYDCTMYQDKLQLILELGRALSKGERCFVSCSRKSDAKFLEWLYGNFGAVAIHRDNANEPIFENFFNKPNQWFAENRPQCFIGSPILRSGFSITGNFFDKRFTFFEADSIAASTALQQAERYRPLVPTFIFAAYSNHQYRHTTPKDLLQTRRIRAKLSGKAEVDSIDSNDPYFHYKSADNWSKAHFKADLLARLRDEVEVIEQNNSDSDPKELKDFQDRRGEFKEWQDLQLYHSQDLGKIEYEEMKDRRDLLESQLLAVQKYRLADWRDRTPDSVNLPQIERDNNGKKRKAQERLERQAYPSLAIKADRSSLEVQQKWGAGISHQDVTHLALAQRALESLGLHEFLDFALSGEVWAEPTDIVKTFGSKLRNARNFEQETIKYGKVVVIKSDQLADLGIHLVCGRTGDDNTQVGSLLRWLGLETVRSQKMVKGARSSSYRLSPDDLKLTRSDLTRRANRLIRDGFELTPSHAFVERLVEFTHTYSKEPTKEVCVNFKTPQTPQKVEVEVVESVEVESVELVESIVVMPVLVEQVDSVEQVKVVTLVEQVDRIEQPQPHKPIPFTPKEGMAVLHKDFQCIIKRVGTATAKIVSIATGYDWGYVDFAELQVA